MDAVGHALPGKTLPLGDTLLDPVKNDHERLDRFISHWWPIGDNDGPAVDSSGVEPRLLLGVGPSFLLAVIRHHLVQRRAFNGIAHAGDRVAANPFDLSLDAGGLSR
ncbi:hypothetical protein [Amycolatopsis sp. NPDC052450]|uniref:hypothetical protein n=1 Tax=Amycolatopsis sp. NPDC052450 TaxID=3363937 RepID=UPI0037C8D1B7